MKLNPASSAPLVYSTYLGGSGAESVFGVIVDAFGGIAVDALGNAYVTSTTESTAFPTTMGALQPTFGGAEDAFVAKITGAVPPPPATVGKVTGGGTIIVPGGIANFGFIVQAQSSTGPIRGDLLYVNHSSGANVQSVIFNSLVIAGNTATFGGSCTNNGVPCTFTVRVQDNGGAGSDSFAITVNAEPPEGANESLRSGNVLIHK